MAFFLMTLTGTPRSELTREAYEIQVLNAKDIEKMRVAARVSLVG